MQITLYICMQAKTYVHGVKIQLFIVNVLQYLLRIRAKKTPEKTFTMFSFHVHKFWRGAKK